MAHPVATSWTAPTGGDDLIEEHCAWLRLRGLSPNTIRVRRDVLLNTLDHLELDDLRQVTSEQLRDVQRYVWGYLGPESHCAYVTRLRSFYQWALQEGYVNSDPTTLLVRPKVPRRLPRPISEDALSLAIAGAHQPMRLWLMLAAYAGLRACEVATLRREDVLDTANPPILLVIGKGNTQRAVPLGEALMDELSLALPGLPSSGCLFLRDDAQPRSPEHVSRKANEYLRRQGIQHHTFHTLRHRFATQVYRATTDLLLLQNLLGHANPATTAVYAAFSQARGVAAVQALDALRRADL